MSESSRRLGSIVASMAVGLVALCGPSSRGATIEMVLVGDVGNAADTRAGTPGKVNYVYAMGKYEVTNAQYVEFLNAKDPNGTNPYGLYDTRMNTEQYAGGILYMAGNAAGNKYVIRAGRANNPVAHVSWFDSARFVNWVQNGMGTGNTETGTYTLLGGTAVPSNATTITRNPGASFVLPNENEWYKAAFYKGGGTNAGYWTYATQSDTLPTAGLPPGGSNSANHKSFTTGHAVDGSMTNQYGTTNLLTDVGAYVNSPGTYGTYDQAGLLFEWMDDLMTSGDRVIRGGAWYADSNYLVPTQRQEGPGLGAGAGGGFRLAAVPEPTGVAGVLLAGVFLTRRGRRRSR
jgi:sulfatase modifying factor 1